MPRNIPLLPFTESLTLEHCISFEDAALPVPTVFIASYPKSGTTWMQAIVFHLLNINNHIKLTHISHFCPFYELNTIWKENGSLKDEPYQNNHTLLGSHVFNTHMLPHMLPLQSPTTKVIYIVRNARDVLTSFYYHLTNQIDHGGSNTDSFTSFASQWASGSLPYGTWLHHIDDWLLLQQTHPASILFIRYEDLIKDLSKSIKQVAEHLEITVTEEDIQQVALRCSFAQMQEDLVLYQPISVQWKHDFKFIRKGQVGDTSLLDSTSATEAKHIRGIFDDIRVKCSDLSPQNGEFIRQLL